MEETITVKLQTITDVRYSVKMKNDCTVEDLKYEVFKSTGIRNKLKLLKDKDELDDRRILRSYGIEDQTVLQMLMVPPEMITLDIYMLKKGTVTLDVSDNNSFEDLRCQLLEKLEDLRSPLLFYDFYLNSQKCSEITRPLHLCISSKVNNIFFGSKDEKIRLYLSCADDFTMVRVVEFKGADTVAELTNEVLKVLSETEKSKVERGDIVLFLRPLENRNIFYSLDIETLTLIDYKMRHFDEVFFIKYNMDKYCDIDCDGISRRIYDVKIQEGVLSIRLKIQDQLGIPCDKQNIKIPNMKDPGYGKKISSLAGIRLEQI